MNLTAFLMLCFSLQVSAVGISQTITLSAKDVPLEVVFKEIKKQSGYLVSYNASLLKTAKPVTVSVKDYPFENFIRLILAGQNLNYVLKDKSIVIIPTVGSNPRLSSEAFKPQLPLPPITFRGRVINEKGHPVTASIAVKNTKKGSITDIDGNFTLNNVDENATLVISGVSIETQEVTITGLTSIIINAVTKINAEEEVIIRTDYFGSTKRRSTMNISKVDGKEIQNQPVTTLLNSIVGRVPGIDITPVSGFPGKASIIQIRGNNSLRAGGSFPLYVVDGVQIDSRPLSGAGNSTISGFDPLGGISPNDIESIEVLKDAAATAIYGSRGANGVVRITTKRASPGQGSSNFNLNVYTGIGKLYNRLNLLNREEYLLMRNEAYKNAGIVPGFFEHDLNGNWDTTRSTDWQDVLLGGTANITDVQGSLYGGTALNSFKIGAGYHKETTIYPGNYGYQRASGDFSFRHVSNNKKLEVLAGINYGFVKNKSYNGESFVNLALTLPPIAPKLYNNDGSLNWQEFGNSNPRQNSWSNPMAELLNQNNNITNSIISSGQISYELISGLKIQTTVSLANIYNDETTERRIASFSPWSQQTSLGSKFFINNNRKTFMIEPKLTYTRNVNNHHFNSIAGFSYQQARSIYKAIEGRDYPSDALLGSIKGSPNVVYSSDENSQYKYVSAYLHLGYNYRSKYLVDLTGRRDGSSRFGPGKRYGNFGAIGIGWVFSEESFLKDKSDLLSFGKIRSSFGVTGNDQIGDFQYLDAYTLMGVGYQGVVSLTPSHLFNPDYAWEATRKTEVALELSFLKNRISIDAAWYRNISSNQLVNYTLAATTGYQSVNANFDATIENTGWEFLVSTKNVSTRDFSWNTSFNLTIPRNKLLKFDNIESSPYVFIYKVGEPLDVKRFYNYKGIDPATGYYQIEDIDNNGYYDENDKRFVPLNRSTYYGLTNNLRYKKLELSFLLQFSNNPIYNTLFTNQPGARSFNQPKEVLDRWQKPGDQTNYQKFIPGGDLNYQYALQSDLNIKGASFVRLKTLSLSYTLQNNLASRAGMKEARVYLQGQNIFTLTNFEGFDPETGNGMPPLRMVTIGLQLMF